VTLVWGIDGWNTIPEEIQPFGTHLENKVMYTPMKCTGDTFTVQIKAPDSSTIEYGFLINQKRNGTTIQPEWDGNYEYQPTSAKNDIIKVKSALNLVQAKELATGFDIFLYLFTVVCIIFGVRTIIKRNPGLPNQEPVFSYQESLNDCVFLFIVVLISFILYIGKLGFYCDDWGFLGQLKMTADQSFSNLFHIFYDSPVVKSRPVGVLNYTILYWLFGLDPLGFHLVNAAVFLSGIMLFYLTLRELGQRRIVTLAIPLVYALLPHYSTVRFWPAASGINLSMALYFLSFYADLRTLRLPMKRISSWKLVSLLSLLGSLLTYEVFLPLFFFILFLLWHRRKRQHSTGDKFSSKMSHIVSWGGNLLVLIAVIIFKVMTARIVNQGSLPQRIALVVKQAFDPNYSYGFNIKQAFRLNFGEYGLELPRIIWKILDSYPDIIIFSLGGALGLFITGYLYHISDKSETLSSDFCGEILRLVAWGTIFFGLGYAIFLTNSRLTLALTGVGNRVNIAAAIGIAISFVGLIGWFSSVLPFQRMRQPVFYGLITLLCITGFLINNTIARYWVEAYDKEKLILADIQQQNPTLPKGSTLLLDGVCPYHGPAIVFESHWGLAWALMMYYNDSSLRADVISPKMKIQKDGIYFNLYHDNLYPYKNLFIYHYGMKQTFKITDNERAIHYFETNNPEFNSDCPEGSIGHGVAIF